MKRRVIEPEEKLSILKTVPLSLQHLFAMFGATVLVPLLTGLSVSTTLLAAGVGTLLFHFITKGKVPIFLGSSFAFLGGFAVVAPKLLDPATGEYTLPNTEMLPYACTYFRLQHEGSCMKYPKTDYHYSDF